MEVERRCFGAALASHEQEFIDKVMDSFITLKEKEVDEKGVKYEEGWFDFMYLLGLTSKFNEEDYERKMTDEELKLYNDLSSSEFEEKNRLLYVGVAHKEKELFLYVNYWLISLTIALMRKFPEHTIAIRNMTDFLVDNVDGCDNYDSEEYTYLIKDGKVIEEDTRNKALNHAEAGEYEYVKELLLPLAYGGDERAINDIGVCFEKIGDYKKAKDYYMQSSDNTAKENLLKLFDSKRIAFDEEEYIKAAKWLMENDSPKGFLYMAYYYEGLFNNEPNIDKALEYLDYGYNEHGWRTDLVFERAYILDTYVGSEEACKKSHKLYFDLINEGDDGYAITAKYNYAKQTYLGRGCTKNVYTALRYYILAAMDNYKDAYKELINIYENDKEIANFEYVKMWMRVLENRKKYLEE